MSHAVSRDESVISWRLGGEQKGSRGYRNIGTSLCVALIFERTGGINKPGPPLAARNSSSMRGAAPDRGSPLSSKLPHAADRV